jgi:quinone-modifying oxidoreductase subunit QmoC
MASSTKNGSSASPWAGRVQYESELDPGFPETIARLPGGENLLGCIQCGTCAGSCPVSPYMDLTPREIIAMTRAGFKREVLGSRTIWLCASCYACTVACPKQIRITDIMYALKRQAIQEGRHPKRFPITVLAREFYKQVRRYGRNSEGQLIVRLYANTNPLHALKNLTLGLRLFLRGRIDLKAEKVRDRASVQTLLRGSAPVATKKEAAA